MSRILFTWIAFGLCMVVAVMAMGWVSLKAVRLEDMERTVRRQAVQEENIRLALWRLDSRLGALVARESARPYFTYRPFYAVDRAYVNMFTDLGPQDTPIPSPLLTYRSGDTLVHFQIEPHGEFTSPQSPTGHLRTWAVGELSSSEHMDAAAQRLVQLRMFLDQSRLLADLPEPELPHSPLWRWPGQVQEFLVAQQGAEQVASPGYQTQAAAPRRISSSRPADQIEPQQFQQLSQMAGAQSAYPQAGSVQPAFSQQTELTQQVQPSLQQDLAQRSRKGSINVDQRAKNTVEYLMRSRAAQSYSRDNTGANNFMNVLANGDCSTCPVVAEGVLKPVWVSGALLLARRVSAGGEEYVQGCWLNWPAIRDSLLEDVADLLPNARLEPTAPVSDARQERMLAALPVRLIPGAVPVELGEAGNPLRWSLAVAWACVMLAGLAVAVLLRGAIVLSERRGAFVSAVTHELRTPLTTLRMYTEMLADGMVRDDEKRRSYFQTLRAEADRLGHLVENVLAYSRIERGRARSQIVTLSIGALIARVRERLGERAQQAGMELAVEPNGAEQVDVRADPSAVEQILFNLVDNACKYAVCGRQPLIHLEATRVNGQAILCVRDHGPGIQQQETRRLFRPFSKSARDAANSAPGVGLGLALSRRLAREMGGDLRLDSTQNDGACFLLFLPVGHAES